MSVTTMQVEDYDVAFLKNKVAEAVEFYKQLAEQHSGKELEPKRHCSSCRCHESLDEIFGEAMREITGYKWGIEPSGNVQVGTTIIVSDERTFWWGLAPWVRNGSWIEIVYRDCDDKYRIYFDSGKPYIQSQIISWPETSQDEGSDEMERPSVEKEAA